MAEMTEEEKAAAAAQAEQDKAAADAAAKPGKSPERKAAEAIAKDLRKQADEARRDPSMSQADRAAYEHNAIRAELDLNPRDEFREKPPAYIVAGQKVGPNGRPLDKSGREEEGPVIMWMPGGI